MWQGAPPGPFARWARPPAGPDLVWPSMITCSPPSKALADTAMSPVVSAIVHRLHLREWWGRPL